MEQRKAQERLALPPPSGPVREARVTPERAKEIMAEVYGSVVADVSIPSKRVNISFAY